MNIFKPIREIYDRLGNLHFRRWSILSTPWFSIYLHKIYRSDEDFHQHDHPWSFLSFILSGGYIEESEEKKKEYRRFSWNFKRAETPHKIQLTNGPTTTLIFCGPRRRTWGYHVNQPWGIWLPNEEYRKFRDWARTSKNKEEFEGRVGTYYKYSECGWTEPELYSVGVKNVEKN